MVYYDAHNHLQDERLAPFLPQVARDLEREPIRRMVVNGSCEADWDRVLQLAREDHRVIPSLGYHPWHVKERTADWQQRLVGLLDQVPHAAIGEIGLDRWIPDFDLPAQEQVFGWQLRLAAEWDRPASIHCLKAWGRLLELLEAGPRPARGFLLHSYGGPKEMIPALTRLGAYFSFPGYFAHERKVAQREVFREVPADRLLVETDAPDQVLPEALTAYELRDSAGKRLNHPGNISKVYEFLADWLGTPLGQLCGQVEANFVRLFGQ